MKTAELLDDLVSANHILAHLGVIDGFGHPSVRIPECPDHFLIARNMTPALVQAEDILTLDMEGSPTDKQETRSSYLERFLHAEIYRRRPDVGAIVHSHAPSIIPFGLVKDEPLTPVYHMAAGMGAEIPIFEIREQLGDSSNLLITNSNLGSALADVLGQETLVLMRGHGMTVAGRNLREAVFIAAYADINARIQLAALQLGRPVPLTKGEIRSAWEINSSQIDKSWFLWLNATRSLMQ